MGRKSLGLWVALGLFAFTPPINAQYIPKLIKGLRLASRAAVTKEAPVVPGLPPVEQLAREIDWLEHLVETYGSVVPKHPDIWGEERLTKHLHEYEKEIAKRFDSTTFDAGLQAAVRRSDQSMLALAFALNAASGGASVPTTNNAVTLLGPQGFGPIPQTPPLGLDLKNFATKEISLEPTVVSDQLSRYLNHLNQLRRINEGGDTADSPGYALNLVRIPVSVLSGHHTHKGYGAEITFTLEPYISDDLLPTTMHNLIIGDVAQMWVVPLAQLFNNDPADAKTFIKTHWQFRTLVNEWMQKIEMVFRYTVANLRVRDPGNPHAFQADIEYLLFQRSYLAFRLTQLAGMAAEEREYRLSNAVQARAADSAGAEHGGATGPDCVCRPECPTAAEQPRPVFLTAIPPCCDGAGTRPMIVTVWPCDLVEFLSALDCTRLPPVGVLRVFVDGSPRLISISVDPSRIVCPGDVVDRHRLPFVVDEPAFIRAVCKELLRVVDGESFKTMATRKRIDSSAVTDLENELKRAWEKPTDAALFNVMGSMDRLLEVRRSSDGLLEVVGSKYGIPADALMPETVVELFASLDETRLAELFSYLPVDLRIRILTKLDSTRLKQLLLISDLAEESRTWITQRLESLDKNAALQSNRISQGMGGFIDKGRSEYAGPEQAPNVELARDILKGLDADALLDIWNHVDSAPLLAVVENINQDLLQQLIEKLKLNRKLFDDLVATLSEYTGLPSKARPKNNFRILRRMVG